MVNARLEGYGPGGAALLIEMSTAVPDSTVTEVRRTLRCWGGLPGAPGAVSYLFNHVGVLDFAPESDARRLVRVASHAGAEEVVTNPDGSIQVLTDPIEFDLIRGRLAEEGYAPVIATVTHRAAQRIALSAEDALCMGHLMQALKDLPGVLNVYTNAEIPDQGLARR